MMRTLIAGLLISLTAVLTAGAEPSVKIINFTADWCPNCQILNPRLEEAMESFEDGSIERVDLDVTRRVCRERFERLETLARTFPG